MKKYILVFTLVALIIGLSPTFSLAAKKSSVSELQSAITKLQEQMKALQSEITELQAQLELAKAAEIKFTKTLRRGMSGKDVKNLQQFLIDYEVYTGRINGIFDVRTTLAVKKIQKQLGLRTTGIVDAKTRILFNELLSETEEDDEEEVSEQSATSTPVSVIKVPTATTTQPTATTTTQISQVTTYISTSTPMQTYTSYTSAPTPTPSPATSPTSIITTPTTTISVIYPNLFSQIYPPLNTPTTTISVIYPNSTIEQWTIGNSYEIRWTSTGISNVYIDLTATSGVSYIITSNTSASVGRYSWQVSSSTPAGSGYKIRVMSYPPPSSSSLTTGVNYDQSDNYFTIVAPPPVIPTINVSSPNGGEQLTAGNVYTITWTSTNLDRATIEYQPETGGSLWIGSTDSGASGGSYNWTVPANLTPGNYKIKITNSNYTVSDASDNYFRVTVPVVSGTPPIGHWKFDGNGNNEVAGGPTAIAIGNAVFQSEGGKINGYAYIPSTSDYVRIPYSSAFDLPNSFSIEFWFRQRSNQSFFQDLVYKGSGMNNYNFRVFRQLWNEYNFGPIITGYTSSETGWWTQTSNPNQLTHNVWHHVAFVKSPSFRAYYLDGVEIHSSSGTDSPPAKTPATDIVVGDSAVDTDIDNLQIYDRALSYGEITQHAGLAAKSKSPIIAKPKPKLSQQQLANVAASISQLVEEIKRLLGK